MRPFTPQGCSPDRPWERVRKSATAALLIDVDSARLVHANDAARALWWPAGTAVALPAVLDAAMPALQTLRRLDGHQPAIELMFWTARGPQRLICDAEPADGAGRWCLAGVSSPLAAVKAEQAPRQPVRDASSAAKLAHELRTPLGAVVAYAEVMAQEHFGPIDNARYRDYAANIFASARHALSVVDGMMATGDAPARNGARELRFKDLDPAQIVDSCITVMRPIADGAHVLLDVIDPSGLPRIVADAVSLRQMLLNLLTNAVKFARPGDRVTLSVSRGDDGSLTFAVEDTGPGMESGRAQGQDLDGEIHKPGRGLGLGLGLGLPLTRELAAANGAALAIDSAPGLGTRARISFGATRVVPAW